MESVGIRELRQRTSEILRRVREGNETVTITYRGRAVARLAPVRDGDREQAERSAVWADMDDLAREIGGSWPADSSATNAVREQRREL